MRKIYVAILIILIYVLIKVNNRIENFDTKSNEAVQNIANLYANGDTMILNNLEIKNKIKGVLNTDNDIILNQGNGGNKWSLHAPDDNKKTLFIGPHASNGQCCDWDNGLSILNNGTVNTNTINSTTLNSGAINTTGNIMLNQGDGKNKWALSAPSDDKKTLYISPYKSDGTCCDSEKNVSIDNNGTMNISGNLNIGGIVNSNGGYQAVIWKESWDRNKFVKYIENGKFFTSNMPDGTIKFFAPYSGETSRNIRLMMAMKVGKQFLTFNLYPDHVMTDPWINSSNDISWRGNILS